MRSPSLFLIAAAGLVLATPIAALACPVCGFAGTANNNGAYEATTVLLSAVPLSMIAGITFWLVRRARRQS
jgi:hypothetical protein